MAAIVQKDWKTAHELIRWWHNTPKQIVGSEIDEAIKWAWDAAIAAEALKPSAQQRKGDTIRCCSNCGVKAYTCIDWPQCTVVYDKWVPMASPGA